MSQKDGLGYSITDWYVFTRHGEVAGSASAVAFPTVTAKWVKFKAKADNANFVYIGLAGVTVMAGTTTTTAGWELDGGQETDWIPVPGGSLANIFYICTGAGDDVGYMVLE